MIVGTGPPDELQEMVVLLPSKTINVLVPASELGLAKYANTLFMVMVTYTSQYEMTVTV